MTCRSITESAERLACYDAAASGLAEAERTGDVVMIDRAQVTATRRQLFGFQLPSLSVFDQGDHVEQVDSIETTLAARAILGGDDRWTFTLADGSVWRQIETAHVNFRNQPGEAVRIRSASMGSYMLAIGHTRSVRVRRQ